MPPSSRKPCRPLDDLCSRTGCATFAVTCFFFPMLSCGQSSSSVKQQTPGHCLVCQTHTT